jgi:hypothetical protein
LVQAHQERDALSERQNRAQSTSVRSIPKKRSCLAVIGASFTVAQKLGTTANANINTLFIDAAYVRVAMKNIIDSVNNKSNVHFIVTPSFFINMLYPLNYRYLIDAK